MQVCVMFGFLGVPVLVCWVCAPSGQVVFAQMVRVVVVPLMSASHKMVPVRLVSVRLAPVRFAPARFA